MRLVGIPLDEGVFHQHFFGIGDDYYPLPWPSLKYNTDLGGYQIMITSDQLKGAPKYARSDDYDWSGSRKIDDYYGVALS